MRNIDKDVVLIFDCGTPAMEAQKMEAIRLALAPWYPRDPPLLFSRGIHSRFDIWPYREEAPTANDRKLHRVTVIPGSILISPMNGSAKRLVEILSEVGIQGTIVTIKV